MKNTIIENVYFEKYTTLLKDIKDFTSPERISKIEKNINLSDKQKELFIHQRHKSVRLSLRFLRNIFDDFSNVLSVEQLNTTIKDGENLATILAKGILSCQDEKVVEKYYETLDLVVEKGIRTDIKDNNNCSAADYLCWAKPNAKRNESLAKIDREDSLSK